MWTRERERERESVDRPWCAGHGGLAVTWDAELEQREPVRRPSAADAADSAHNITDSPSPLTKTVTRIYFQGVFGGTTQWSQNGRSLRPKGPNPEAQIAKSRKSEAKWGFWGGGRRAPSALARDLRSTVKLHQWGLWQSPKSISTVQSSGQFWKFSD